MFPRFGFAFASPFSSPEFAHRKFRFESDGGACPPSSRRDFFRPDAKFRCAEFWPDLRGQPLFTLPFGKVLQRFSPLKRRCLLIHLFPPGNLLTVNFRLSPTPVHARRWRDEIKSPVRGQTLGEKAIGNGCTGSAFRHPALARRDQKPGARIDFEKESNRNGRIFFIRIFFIYVVCPQRAAKRHISSGTKSRISNGRQAIYRVPLRGTYRPKFIAG